MATARRIHISSPEPSVFTDDVKPGSAPVATEILQEDLENHHIFFGPNKFHNHLTAQTLTLYSLGATPDELRTAYDSNKKRQDPALPVDEFIVLAMSDKSKFKDFLSDDRNYPNFLAFFQREIETKGLGETICEHLLTGDDHANNILVRMFSGYLHPLIRFGLGIEWGQPAIIAASLAESAVQEPVVHEYLLRAERTAKELPEDKKTQDAIGLLDEIREDETLRGAAQWADSNKARDGVLKRAPDEMNKYASRYAVHPATLDEAIAQMINATAYMTGGAQNPPKQVRFDFTFIHALNASVFFQSIKSLPYITTSDKVRLLEWKVRCDILMYAAHNAPKLVLSPIMSYEDERDWRTMFDIMIRHPNEDVHTAKTLRAIANGQRICAPFEKGGRERGFFVVDSMWIKMANLLIDSIKDHQSWVTVSGFEQAWINMQNQSGM
ncbi:hypothetical protein Plec18167_004823 [Paecilomyces lecythidis]|uniref:Uncharacterized protein n=1 Tax=Paecilomyces lecythidis TaxID=3004212 RepID=A0ABR3XNQ6_9EURO